MKEIILDTNILIQFPEILSTKYPETNFLVPDLVVQQLLNNKNLRRKELVEIIENAQRIGNVQISPTSLPKTPLIGSIVVDFTDFNIAGYGRFLMEQGKDVIIATNDEGLRMFALSNSIKAVGSTELFSLLHNGKTDTKIQDEAKTLNKRVRYDLYVALVSVLFHLLAIVSVEQVFEKIKLISVPLVIALLIFCGFYFYTLRERQRFVYSIIEICIGIIGVIWSFAPDFSFDTLKIDMLLAIKIISSLYIMVRGLDNFSKAIEGTRLSSIFKMILLLK